MICMENLFNDAINREYVVDTSILMLIERSH